MATIKHTPGPWVVGAEIKKEMVIPIDAEGGVLVTCVNGWRIEAARNAQLIAAAPELLAQLRASVEITRVWHGMGAYGSEIENRMWKIYYTMSPEMRPIRELLEKLESL